MVDFVKSGCFKFDILFYIDIFSVPFGKGPVKLIQQVKIAHSFLQSVSNQFHFIILYLPV